MRPPPPICTSTDDRRDGPAAPCSRSSGIQCQRRRPGVLRLRSRRTNADRPMGCCLKSTSINYCDRQSERSAFAGIVPAWTRSIAVGRNRGQLNSEFALVALPFAHTWPTLHPGAARRLVLPGRAAPAQRARLYLRGAFAKHWGETGGTPKDKDGEIRVRTGKLSNRPWLGRAAPTGVFCRGYVENKGDVLAPQVGFEPTTLRLTAEPLVAALRCKHK